MSTENIFLNLHVHSHYSARDSLIGIDDLVDLAKKNNEAVAICDHGSLHSWFEIDQKFSNAGLKPVYGVEAYVNRHRDRLFEIKQELKGLKDKERRANLNAKKKKIESYEHVVLIAKNQWGFHNIIRLMNNAYRNSFHKKPIITFD
ncbi:MAG TPA: PHP domain-containing protein, partial [Paludibacter sp.]|nr:PHP domain-containing protein [Paludibacter sp.]